MKQERCCDLVIWVLLVLIIKFSMSESNSVNGNATLFTDRCSANKTVLNKIELLEMGIENLKNRLNTLDIITDQLFGELKAAIADIPRQNISATTDIEHGCYSSSDKQCDALETTTKPIQTRPSDTFNPNSIPSNCQGRQNGTHLIRISNSRLEPFNVYCIEDQQPPDGVAWIIIQRRCSGNVDFYRNWSDYKHGFGNLEDEFFIGLEKLYAMTRFTLHELWIQMQDFSNKTTWARYSSFAIGDESESYALNVLGSFTGNAGDSLEIHAGQKFTTKDVDNDMDEDNNCAVTLLGGWWYKDCWRGESNLNGVYYGENYSLIDNKPVLIPIIWETLIPFAPLKYVHMAIRPLDLNNMQDGL